MTDTVNRKYDTGRANSEIGVGKGPGRVPAELQHDSGGTKSVRRVDGWAKVGERHDGSSSREQLGSGDATACCSDHEHAAVPHEVACVHVITESSAS